MDSTLHLQRLRAVCAATARLLFEVAYNCEVNTSKVKLINFSKITGQNWQTYNIYPRFPRKLIDDLVDQITGSINEYKTGFSPSI